MHNNLFKKLSLFLLILPFLYAVELAFDNFSSGLNGWSGNGVSVVNEEMRIDRDSTAEKIYNFGSNHQNETVTIQFNARFEGSWDSGGIYQDYFRVYVNDELINEISPSDGETKLCISANTDLSGNLKLQLEVDTTANSEIAFIDNISIQTDSYCTEYNENSRNFVIVNPENTRNISGDFLVTGNTIECVTEESWDFNGQCTNDHNKNDNNYAVKYIDIDNDSKTFNSSSAYLTLPSDFKEILWAGLFWQGNVNGVSDNYGYPRHQRRAIMDSNTTWHYEYNGFSNNPIDIRNTDANTVLFKIEGMNDYQKITAKNLDYYRWYWIYGAVYSSYADITELVKEKIDNNFNPGDNVTITVANITTNEGREQSLGDYGAWTLVVVYKGDNNSKFKRVLIYNGYEHINVGDNPNETITIDNLYLPQYGDVLSTFAAFAGEGEEPYYPDHMRLENQNMPGARDPNNIFDARLANINRPVIGDNNVTNTNGIDIDVYDVTSIMTQVRDNNPDTSSVELSLDTNWDAYFPSMIAFSVQLYQPKICYEETLYDSNGNEINSNSNIQVGDTLRVHLMIRNDDNENAKNVKIKKFFDENSTKYVENSTCVDDVDTEKICYNDNSGLVYYDSNNKILEIGYLGEGDPPVFKPYAANPDHIAYIDYNFTIQSDQNISLTYETSYIFEIAGQTFDFNGNLPKCSDFNNTISPYRPELGTFNVVNKNFSGNTDPTDQNSSLNSLYTQIVNKPFDIKILHLKEDKTTLEPTSGVVFLDLVDASTITSDPNSCKNANILYKLPGKGYTIDFGDKNSQTSMQELSDIIIPKASKNATFRVKYIDWANVIHNSGVACADVSDMSSNLKGVPACLDSGNKLEQVFPNTPCRDTQTGAPCLPQNHGVGDEPYDHEYGCAQCLMDYNASYVCARDNFSIRPDTYSLDINASPLIGGRYYTLNVTAKQFGNDTNSSNYNQIINNSNDKNITATLKIPSGCTLPTDISPAPISSISFSDGIAQNIQFKYNNVGDVNLTIIDNDWTKVDQQPKSDNSIDCIEDSDTNIENSGKVGCLIKKSQIFTFVPKAYKNILNIENFNNKFTYISNNKNMAAKLKFTIEAILDNNSTATNYTAGCFAKDINYTISLINDKNLTWSNTKNRIKYFDDNSTSKILNLNNDIVTLKTAEGNFTNGKSNPLIMFNFDRNISAVDSPFIISKNDFNISVIEINGSTTGEDFDRSNDQNVTFYYARVHSPDYIDKDIDNSINAIIYYEVYDKNKIDPANIEGDESIDDVDWYINRYHSINDGNISSLTPSKPSNIVINPGNSTNITNGKENQTIIYNGSSFPYKDKIDINASSWLIYNKFDQNASTNHFYVTFPGKSKDWAGIGKVGKTIDLNVSTSTQERIDW